jgi:hypothetical protein
MVSLSLIVILAMRWVPPEQSFVTILINDKGRYHSPSFIHSSMRFFTHVHRTSGPATSLILCAALSSGLTMITLAGPVAANLVSLSFIRPFNWL